MFENNTANKDGGGSIISSYNIIEISYCDF